MFNDSPPISKKSLWGPTGRPANSADQRADTTLSVVVRISSSLCSNGSLLERLARSFLLLTAILLKAQVAPFAWKAAFLQTATV